MAGDYDIDADKENAAPPVDSRDALSQEDRAKFNELVLKAKHKASQGHIRVALELNQRALKLCPSEKLTKRITKMEAYIKEYEDDEDDSDGGDEMVHVGEGFYLFKELYSNLYSHQRDGVVWMWRVFKQRKGGILGDDMGLGKTIQVIAFLSGMFDAEKIRTVLIILPVAVIMNWEREFQKWAPGIRVEAYHGGTKNERERTLTKIHRRGGVMITTYGMLVNNAQQLAEKDGRDFVWDAIILDEGHKIKNPSVKCSKGLHKIAARYRLILTGTPVQNNLREMWALFDWTHQGSLLGTAKTFSMEFDGPISRARQKDALPGEERLGQEIANSLKKIIGPYFLRRTKAQVKQAAEAGQGDSAGTSASGLAPKGMPILKRKNDFIIWAYMSKIQQKIYKDFANSESVTELLNTSRSPLTALTVLKKICDHPRLMTNRQCKELGLNMDEEFHQKGEDSECHDESAVNRIDHIPNEELVGESGKMVFLVELLDNLKSEGHRCLVFSQSRKVLDILQKVLRARGHKVARVDGTMRHLAERDDMINKFSTDKRYSVFLLTTQVGGVGLNITAADRVVIYDPSWNPATDAQAVDRAFRIGQEHNVVIYRIITCGSIEEKIYRRQIFKDSITKQATGESNNPYKYFTRQELFELFKMDNPRESLTQQALSAIHEGRRSTDTSLDAHIAFLLSTDIYGITDHDLMWSVEHKTSPEEEMEVETGKDYINQRVQRANQLISMESESNVQLTQELGKYPAPEVNKVKATGDGGGGGARNYNWQFGHGSTSEPETKSQPTAIVDLTKAHEDDDSDVTEINTDTDSSHDSSAGHEDREDDTLANDIQKFNFRDEPQVKPTTLAGVTAHKPIMLEDSPVRPRLLINDTSGTLLDASTSVLVLSDLDSDPGEEQSSRSRSSSTDSEDMVVGESFHTPDTTGTPARLELKKRDSLASPEPRPGTKKRRRSVAWTPGRGGKLGRPVSPSAVGGDSDGMDDVIAEELVFSPTAARPLLQTEVQPRLSEMHGSSGDYPMDYQDFAEQVNSRCNSTALYDVRAAAAQGARPGPGSSLGLLTESETEHLSESEEPSRVRQDSAASSRESPHSRNGVLRDSRNVLHGLPSLDESASDSPITVKRSKKKAVISSDEEADEEDVPEEESSLGDSRLASPINVDGSHLERSKRLSVSSLGSRSIVDSSPVLTAVSTEEASNDSTLEESIYKGGNISHTIKHLSLHSTPAPPGRSTTAHSQSLMEAEKGHSEIDHSAIVGDNEEEVTEEEESETDESVNESGTAVVEDNKAEEFAMESKVDEESEDEEEDEEDEDEEDEDEDEEEEDEEDLTEEQQTEYLRLMTESRKYYKQGEYATALTLCVDALDIYSGDERAKLYAIKLQHKLS